MKTAEVFDKILDITTTGIPPRENEPTEEYLDRVYKTHKLEAMEILESFAKEKTKEFTVEILDELHAIRAYMEEKNAFHGYGQMNDLITKLNNIK